MNSTFKSQPFYDSVATFNFDSFWPITEKVKHRADETRTQKGQGEKVRY